jgi:hypothetical protein
MSAFPRRLAALLVALALFSPKIRAAEPTAAESTIDLTPRVTADDLAEVTIEIEGGGNMQVRDSEQADAATKDTADKDGVRSLPMSASAKLQYDEHRVAPTSGHAATRAIRYYKNASAVLKVDDGGSTPKLDDDRRLIVAQFDDPQLPGGRLSFAAAKGLLTREELDLIDVTGDSLAVDALLPKKPVAVDATWPADPNTMAAILSMDSVAAAEVQNVLDKFNHDFALVRLAGTVVGVADGSTTEMEVRGVYLFDRKLARVTRFNLAVKEKRSIGGATPGVDGVAKLRMNVKPITSSEHLPPATLAALESDKNLRVDRLRLEPDKQGYRICHDRRWFDTSHQRESTTLRCVERGDVLAQCTITSLPPQSAANQTTLEEFERDIRFALKDNFGELVASRQWTNSFGNHCLEVVVRGTMEDVPLEWHYYLVAAADPDIQAVANRVSIAVTIQGEMVDRLAAADRQLANAVEFVPQKPSTQTAERNGVTR